MSKRQQNHTKKRGHKDVMHIKIKSNFSFKLSDAYLQRF